MKQWNKVVEALNQDVLNGEGEETSKTLSTWIAIAFVVLMLLAIAIFCSLN